MENTSGMGEKSSLPKEINTWNYGAIFLSAVWGIFNKTYVALLALIPIINIPVMLILGYNGNKWAWRNKKWESVDQFLAVQRKWNIAGFIAFAFYVYVFIKGIFQII